MILSTVLSTKFTTITAHYNFFQHEALKVVEPSSHSFRFAERIFDVTNLKNINCLSAPGILTFAKAFKHSTLANSFQNDTYIISFVRRSDLDVLMQK